MLNVRRIKIVSRALAKNKNTFLSIIFIYSVRLACLQLGRGGYFYWDELTTWIFDALRQKKILIEFERVDKVVNLILKYIDENGGFLE